MALKEGFYPAESSLILDPTDYNTGGTDLGKVGSIFSVSINYEFEALAEHALGNVTQDVRVTGMEASLAIQLIDYSTDLLEVLTNNTNDDDVFKGFTNYKVGEILGDDQINSLVIRPTDATKPFFYIPRAINIASIDPVWDRRLPVTSGLVLMIDCMYDAGISAPVLYGDVDNFPEIS